MKKRQKVPGFANNIPVVYDHSDRDLYRTTIRMDRSVWRSLRNAVSWIQHNTDEPMDMVVCFEEAVDLWLKEKAKDYGYLRGFPREKQSLHFGRNLNPENR